MQNLPDAGGSHALRKHLMTSADDPKLNVTPSFEEILHHIGSRGKFQTRLNVVFICFGSCVSIMSVNIFYLAMQTPDHWCHVPGRELTNLSLEEWKNFTIPREGGSFSKCLMYNNTDTSDISDVKLVKCQYGWDYDTTWFSMTAPSQMNWVCDNQQAVSDVLFYFQIIGTALALLFGYVGDMLGRRPQQLLCVSAHVVSRLLLVLTPDSLALFVLGAALVAGASGPMFESSLSVGECQIVTSGLVLPTGMELTDIKNRAALSRYSCCSTSVGMICAAVLVWALRSWTYYFPFTALCCMALLVFSSWFPESPRWLACRGRGQDALEVLRRVALVNGAQVPPFAEDVMRTVGKAKADRRGFLSVFSSWNVFKNTVLLIVARSVQVLTFYSLLMMVGGIGVDPFLTLASQGAIQLPAYCAINYCADKFGRRWSAVASSLMAAVAIAVLFCMLNADASGIAVTLVVVAITLATTASMGATSLQSLEVHPTCMRQIASSLEWFAAATLMCLLPFLALTNDRRAPLVILSALNLGTAFSVSFLPESALQRLPETLQDAAVFGRGQRYWSWKPKQQPAVPRQLEAERALIESH